MKEPSRHAEWLSLIEVSGPFLALPVLEAAFPQGLDLVQTPKRQRLRAAYDEWCEAVEEQDPLLKELHVEWIRLVLTEALEYDGSTLETDKTVAANWAVASTEQVEAFKADWLVVAPSERTPRLFISIQPAGSGFKAVGTQEGWPDSLAEKMTILCRTHGVPLGLLTDGERWMLVSAPLGTASSDASWYARLWFLEPVTLKAFQSLCSVRRCLGPAEERLESLLRRSLDHLDEITDTLGEQVRRAVEVLVQCLDKADADRNRELLRDVSPAELYEAGLTVMMRLVFILCAEERGLLLLGDPVYDECYAVSTLRAQLAAEGDRHGPEVLDRRHDAWPRLLAVFRAVHQGIEHESLRMPALGGSLFDPERFPFLEGRKRGTTWCESDAAPVPIDNRTVLLLLSSLQLLEQHGGALLLSYRALDVEQIGHVYEGLLEHTVMRVPSVTVGMAGSKNAKNPNARLSELESARLDGEGALILLVTEATGRTESAVRNSLSRSVDEVLSARLLAVCGGDSSLALRIRPFASLLRIDAWGDPIVYREDAFMVTLGADRRETGTHYTPRTLTERIVGTTLEPTAYVGPAEGTGRAEWRLKSPRELLELKVCDPAMGSGAFLVQACRWLADRLVQAWANEQSQGRFVTADGLVCECPGELDPVPSDPDERLLTARRLVAEKCLYGVDVNPLAVELAKLSIWLVTLAKGRPFGFLDHNLRHGDSLLGIRRMEQLLRFTLNTDKGPHQQCLFGKDVAAAAQSALETRKKLRAVPIRDIRDVEAMTHLDAEARANLSGIELVADAVIAEALRSNGNAKALEASMGALAVRAAEFLHGNPQVGASLRSAADTMLATDHGEAKVHGRPFHWPLEFPEVFLNDTPGFDAIVGNPPFLRGTKIQTVMSARYLRCLLLMADGINGNADLCAHFFRLAFLLIRPGGAFCLLATNTIAQGDTRDGGLQYIMDNGGVAYSATDSFPWPGKAAVVVSLVHIIRGTWNGHIHLNSRHVPLIDSHLSVGGSKDLRKPTRLAAHWCSYHNGSFLNGMGFVLTNSEAMDLLSDPHYNEVVRPYIGGKELYSNPVTDVPCRYVIYFGKMRLEQAKDWPLALSIVEERVYPERSCHPTKSLRDEWWLFKRPTPDLYYECNGKERVIAKTQVSSTFAFQFIPANYIFDQRLIIFPDERASTLAVLQSSINEVWAERYSATLKHDMSYTPKDCFETFCFPGEPVYSLGAAGAAYHEHRQQVMLTTKQGLTSIFHRLHDPSEASGGMAQLRELFVALDNAVMVAYKWDDIPLEHGFRKVKNGIRFTISESAKQEVLERLSELNRLRSEEERRQARRNGRLLR